MPLPTPTVVFRSRHFPTAQSLAAFLRESGINAHPVPPNQIGQYGEGPAFDVLYDVWAVDCTNAEVQRLLNDWSKQSELAAASTDLFCYHCGVSLESPLATCPSCGGMLELELPTKH